MGLANASLRQSELPVQCRPGSNCANAGDLGSISWLAEALMANSRRHALAAPDRNDRKSRNAQQSTPSIFLASDDTGKFPDKYEQNYIAQLPFGGGYSWYHNLSGCSAYRWNSRGD